MLQTYLLHYLIINKSNLTFKLAKFYLHKPFVNQDISQNRPLLEHLVRLLGGVLQCLRTPSLVE